MKFTMLMLLNILFEIAFSQNTVTTIEQRISPKKDKLLFHDMGNKNYKRKWFLDGKRAKVINSVEGMLFEAGEEYGNDSSHAVLWTKKSFNGNILVEFDYTRTDTTTRCVNIIYLHATGTGTKEYPKDIRNWKEKREVPKMKYYFNNMHAYHISYAAFDAIKYSGENDYIRLRQYDPALQKLDGTEILPDAFTTGMFKPFITYHIEITLFNNLLVMKIVNKEKPTEQLVCKWNLRNKPHLSAGRIGLRHMYTRNALYKDFKVWEIL